MGWRKTGEVNANGKPLKPPFRLPNIVTNASSTDPKSWASFEAAADAVRQGKAEGVGYATGDGFIFIDLDDCVHVGAIDAEAQTIIDRLDSYTEYSQSGHGIHILVKGKKPTGACRRGNTEIYEEKRFMYLTGDTVEGHATIEERDIGWLCEETFGEVASATTTEAVATEGEEFEAVSDLVLDRDAVPPAGKLDLLLKDRDFKKTWKHQRGADFPSLSEYDL